jgi:WD40 repeat protein
MAYKAFISYSHSADGKLAPALQVALERFAKPWHRMRAFRIFRDTTNLSVAPGLWPEIERALDDSEYLLFLASPEAAQSKWVKKEQTYWREKKDPSKLLIALTSGEIRWDDAAGDFDWRSTTAIPDVLRGAFSQEPLFLDFRNLPAGRLSVDDDVFLDHIATIAAPLHGRSKDEIFGEHIRQHRRTIRLAWSAIVALTFLLIAAVAAGVYATWQRGIAEERRLFAERETRVATAQRLAAQADAARTAYPQRSLLLGVEAMLIAMRQGERPDPAAEVAVRQGLALTGGHIVARHPRGGIASVAISPDDRWLVTGGDDEIVQVRDLSNSSAAPLDLIAADARNSIAPSSRHGTVYALAVSPDGGRLAAATNYGSLWIWDMARLTASPRTATSNNVWMRAAFSGDGNYLITEGNDGPFVWDLTRPDLQPTYPGSHDGNVMAMAIHPDRPQLITVDGSATVRYLDLQKLDAGPTLRPPPQLEERIPNGSKVSRAVMSRDARRLVTLHYNGTALVWDLEDQSAIPWSLPATTQSLQAMALSADGQRFVAMEQDGMLRAWDLRKAEPQPVVFKAQRRHPNTLNLRIEVTPDGERLLGAGLTEGSVWIWELSRPFAEPAVILGHEGGILVNRAFRADGRRFVTLGTDGTAREWDLVDPTTEPTALRGHSDAVHHMAISRDGRRLATATWGTTDTILRVWNPDLPAAAPVALTGQTRMVRGMAFSPDNRQLVVGLDLEDTRVWDLANPTRGFARLDGSRAKDVLVAPDGRLVTLEEDNRVHIRALADLKARPIVLEGPAVDAMALSPDGTRLATAGEDKAARVWDLDRLAAGPAVFAGHEDKVVTLAFSADGRRLATGSSDRTARVWNAADVKAPPIILRGHDKDDPSRASSHLGITTLAFTPDGRRLVTGSDDETARVWDLDHPERAPAVLRGHLAEVEAVAISPDGRRLVTMSNDPGEATGTSVRVWDLDNLGAEPLVLGPRPRIETMLVSPDGRSIIGGCDDGVVRLWSLLPSHLIDLAARVAGRNLTAAEWQQYFARDRAVAYRPTFSNLPVPAFPKP